MNSAFLNFSDQASELELGTISFAELVRNHVVVHLGSQTNGFEGEPTVTGVTGDVTALVQDVTKTGVVRVVVVGVGSSTSTTGEVSGDSGISAAVDVAVTFDHAADETVGSIGAGAIIGQAIGTGASGGGAGGTDEDGVVGQEVIGTENFQTIGTVTGFDSAIGSSVAATTGRTAGELVIEAGAVQLHSGTDLLQVAGAVDATGTFTGLLQSGEQHTSEDRDDRDDDEELDKSESTTFLHFFNPFDCFFIDDICIRLLFCTVMSITNCSYYSKKIAICKT